MRILSEGSDPSENVAWSPWGSEVRASMVCKEGKGGRAGGFSFLGQ